MNISSLKQPSLALKKPSTPFHANPQLQSSLPKKNGLMSPSLKLSTPISPISKQNKPINNKTSIIAANHRLVPPVPPRKSSIPRPSLKPPPPQRNSSNNLLHPKSHVSYL